MGTLHAVMYLTKQCTTLFLIFFDLFDLLWIPVYDEIIIIQLYLRKLLDNFICLRHHILGWLLRKQTMFIEVIYERIFRKMTIFVKNVSWFQNQSHLTVSVPINGTKSRDDIILSEKFLKINVPPYFYQLFFEHPICVEQSSCKILETNIKFQLKKSCDRLWPILGKNVNSSDNSIKNIDNTREIFTEYEKSVQEKYTLKKMERSKLKRNEIDKEIERENRIRMKMEQTESNLKSQHISENKSSVELSMRKVTSIPKRMKDESIPPIRSCGKISVNFTLREFITPKRESQTYTEMEWSKKQHEIMINRIGFCDTDLNADECDLSWVMKKGFDFLEKKNFLAALSAFSFGIKMTNNLPELYLGRARAQYGLQNYKRCAEDCSDALEKFTPEVQSNLLDRIHCFWLRGKSLTFLGLTDHGKREVEMAARLDPLNFKENEISFLKDI